MAKVTNAEKNEVNIEDLKNNNDVATNEKEDQPTEIIVADESWAHKALKWGLRGLACIATGVAGFFIGRATAGKDDDDDDSDKSEDTDE